MKVEGNEKKEGSYSFYDSAGIKTGSLKKTPRGDFVFKRDFKGGLEGFTPAVGQDVGYIDPASFRGRGFKKSE